MNRFGAARFSIILTAIHLCAALVRADIPAGRVAPPDSGMRAQDLKMVDEVYKDQIAKAHTQAEKTALATELIRAAGEAKEKAAEQFALYSRAGDIAAQAEDVTTALAAIDILCRRFEVDALAMKADMLGRLVNSLSQASVQKIFIEHCDAAMDDAVAQERYDVVKRIGDLEASAARKYGDAASLKSANNRIAEMHAARVAYDKHKTALAALGRNPADPAANLAAGSYQCFIREDWKSGLPLLAKGSDAALKSLAEQDLAANADAQARTALADAWWDRSAKERGLAQKHIQRHAATIYTELLPSLTGLTKSKVEKRIATLTTGGVAFGARGMTLDEVLTRFTFPNKTFHLDKDAVTGTAENYDDPTQYVWLTNPETMQSFEFGLVMKASRYQAIVVEIDGRRYRLTHAFQGVNDCKIEVWGMKDQRFPITAKNPNDWAVMKAVVDQNKVTFTYNGTKVGTLDVQSPMSPASKIRVGFSAHHVPISVKDVYLVER